MERVPDMSPGALAAAYTSRRDKAYDAIAARAWLRMLAKYAETPVSVQNILRTADIAVGTAWFNNVYQTCPVAIASASVPKMTAIQLFSIGTRSRIFSQLRRDEDKPTIVLFDSPADGLPMLAAHTDSRLGVFAFRLMVIIDSLPVYIQPADDLARHVASVGWQLYA